MADGVRELQLALAASAGGHDVLRNPATHVRRAAIHFRRILARERAAAVTAHAAIGVDDDLPAGQPGVTLRPADDEASGGIDEELGLLREQSCR